jgi:hypothetical protein
MFNALAFILLAIVSFSVLIFTIIYKKEQPLLVLFFCMTGLAYLLEYFVLILFDSYEYFPNLIQISYFDNMLGAIISQALVIPAASVLIAGFNFKWKGIVMASVIILLIEWYFLGKGLYKHNWWKLEYTAMLLPVGFIIAKIWYEFLTTTMNRKEKMIALFFMSSSIQATILFFFSINDIYLFQVDWFPNPYRDHFSFNTLYVIFTTLLIIFATFYKRSVIWILASYFVLLCLSGLFITTNIVTVNSYWSPFFFIVLSAIQVGITICLQYILETNVKPVPLYS